MSKFVYDADIPEIILPDLRRYLEPLECLVPAWCAQVYIGYDGRDSASGTGCIMDCVVKYHYRWARITVYGRWTNQPDFYKPHAVTHELLHISIDPLFCWATDKIKGLAGDDARICGMLQQEASERVEAVTEDLTGILSNLLNPSVDLSAYDISVIANLLKKSDEVKANGGA